MAKNYQMPEKRFKYTLLSILFVVFIVVVNKPIDFFADSEGYLNMDIYRSAGYPVFLWLLKQISGNHLELVTIIVQAIIGLIVIYFFIIRLKSLIKLHAMWYILLTFILITPYVYHLHLANSYLSEPLTYPLYLIVTVLFLESFLKDTIKKLWIALPFLFVLILTRSQFLFFVPVGVLILLWISIKQRSYKKFILIFVTLLIFPFLTSLADKLYHHLKHDAFVNTPWTGIHIITPAFYVADEADYQLYESKEDQQFFKWIYAKLYHKNLNINNLNEEGALDETAYYIVHFSDIANATIYDSGKELVGSNISENEKFVALDQLTKKMTLTLVIDNFQSWLKLYIKNSINAFGNSKYALLHVLLFLVGLIGLIKNGGNTFKIITFLSLLTFANVALVSLGMHTIKRFIFYNDWVLFLIIFILADAYFKNKKPVI